MSTTKLVPCNEKHLFPDVGIDAYIPDVNCEDVEVIKSREKEANAYTVTGDYT